MKYDNIDEKKIKLKQEAYKRYQDFIKNRINDNFIAEMKTQWLLEIVKMANRPYNMKQYDSLLNGCLKEITLDYKSAMKTSILDYILKHPEQREKLSIPIQFRRIKEYAEEQVTRPSDGDVEWKASWNRNKLTISNNLYIMCENVTKILKYFVKNLKDTSYIDLNENDTAGGTILLRGNKIRIGRGPRRRYDVAGGTILLCGNKIRSRRGPRCRYDNCRRNYSPLLQQN